MLDQVLTSINQSFRLVFESISKGIRIILSQVGKVIDALAKLIKWFHGLIAKMYQLLINLSSLVFIVFVPFAFLFDPLDWSKYLYHYLDPVIVFWGRMVLGAFFGLVAYLVVVSLFKTLKHSDTKPVSENDKKRDFVQVISSALSWVTIGVALAYFTLFRLQLFDFPYSLTDVGNMLGI